MDEQSAFPSYPDADRMYNWIKLGMTMQQWYAGQALTGLLAHGYEPQAAVPLAHKIGHAMVATGAVERE